ncbi:MAG TPA: hypothetical protein VIS52_03225 [Motiliproteus sp.]
MKHRPTKAELRAELERHIDDYLAQGGAINEVPRGASGWATPLAATPDFAFERPKESRTPLPEVVASIEARKIKPTPVAKSRRRAPRKKAIYDDFGELVRWVWVDE